MSHPRQINNAKKARIIEKLRVRYPLNSLLAYFEIPRSTFYHDLSRLDKPDRYANLKQDIIKWFKDSHETYGYRRIYLLAQQAGYPYCAETIRKIMHEMGLQSSIYNRHQRGYSSYHGHVGKVAPNRLNQHFDVTEPYRVLHTDVTQVKMTNGKFGYISAVLDEGSHEILAIQVSSRPDKKLILNTLNQLPDFNVSSTPVLLHSDQGWHYQLSYYRCELKKHHLVQSMSRKGNCHDNAPMESFFNLLKREWIKRKEIKDLNQLQQEVGEYIEWYNTKRISIKLNGMSPCEYRQKRLATV